MPPYQGSLIRSFGHNTPGKVDIALQSALLALAIVTVGLRLWSRRLQRASLLADDWLIVIAILVAIGHYAVGIIMVLLCGLGLHSAEVAHVGGPEAFVRFNELTYTGDLLWVTVVALIQLSILHYYTCIFAHRVLRWLAYSSMGLSWALWIASFLATALFCLPPRRIWLADTPGHCGDRKQLYFSCTVGEVVLSVIIAVLPLPFLWMQQLRKSQKLMLIGIYQLGAVIIVVTGLRIKYIAPPDPGDPTYGSSVGAILSSVVLPLGIILACLPSTLPAMMRLFCPATQSLRTHKHGRGSFSAAFGRTTAFSSGGTQLEEPEIPLVTITQPAVAKTSDFWGQGQIQVTSDWEIHSTRDSSRLCRGSMHDV